ncbi:23S rRNA (uracil(1939)-C(5))-methyltransferase RlmD [Erwinia sp. CPCC 100877]|nr:23S rRNA (uracil(1939)-C(5))-methyltransferase RlmD [Erwinia sp. CPCC 100877]
MAQFYSAKRRVTTRKIITVDVNDLDPFGQGVAHHQGKTLFISGALPGERVEAELREEKRHYCHARLKRLISSSPERVAPRCPHSGTCGGCQQQHASIALQQRSKARALGRMMKRDVDEIISGDPWGYRRRARLSLKYSAQGLQMGFRQAASDRLVDIRQCPILAPQLEALLEPLRACLSGLQGANRLGHAELVLADNGPLLVLRHLAPLSATDRKNLECFSHTQNLALYLAGQSDILEQVSGETPWYQSEGLRLMFSPRDFIQVNDGVNQQMVARAIEWLALSGRDRVLDLFCGMGNFTLPMALRAGQVVGVEGVPALVEKGRENAAYHHLNNVTFWHENLEQDVTRQPWAADGVDKILLDPARAGAAGVIAQIGHLAPEQVVYVSCHPSTLMRDSAALCETGYRLTRLAMLDMFPHTGHLESMALFERR